MINYWPLGRAGQLILEKKYLRNKEELSEKKRTLPHVQFFNCMKHSFLLTRRLSVRFFVFSPFNLQTIIWSVNRCGFILWVTTPESVTSVVSSRFAIMYIVLKLFACTEILSKAFCTTARFTVILVFLNTRFRNQMRKYNQCFLTGLN